MFRLFPLNKDVELGGGGGGELVGNLSFREDGVWLVEML